MKIEISGSKCISCNKYTQYYQIKGNVAEAIDCGFCGRRQRHTRPGNRCKEYQERSNVGGVSMSSMEFIQNQTMY
ncbi:MAG: hypothetical protein HFH50_12975 [Lachnospiraceae bacterium]|jgi:hypothetical protein|nr:hypothetical protein [Lachnospiraceae bacterium]